VFDCFNAWAVVVKKTIVWQNVHSLEAQLEQAQINHPQRA
jgi:hypothetical protein